MVGGQLVGNYTATRKFSTATKMAVGGTFVLQFPEGKIHYLTLSVLPSTNIRSCATMGRNLERNMPSAPVKLRFDDFSLC